jgi:hypothetical protein
MHGSHFFTSQLLGARTRYLADTCHIVHLPTRLTKSPPSLHCVRLHCHHGGAPTKFSAAGNADGNQLIFSGEDFFKLFAPYIYTMRAHLLYGLRLRADPNHSPFVTAVHKRVCRQGASRKYDERLRAPGVLRRVEGEPGFVHTI